MAQPVCQLADFRRSAFLTTFETKGESPWGISLRGAAPGYENQGGGDHDGEGNIAGARIDRRWNGRRQAGIQHAFEPETQPRDRPSQRINHRRYAGVCRTNHRQPLFDRAQARLLQVLIGAGRNAKPAVIGKVDDPARTVIAFAAACPE
jgi:hypothetical protein